MRPLREQFADTMLELGQRDENLVVMVGDISHGILQPFANECPGRYFNIGICEPTIVSMAAGLAKTGLIPVCHTIAPFLIERSYEQLKLDFSYQQLSGNFISVGGAFDYAQLGCSHHCYSDISIMCHLPNSQVFSPGSPQEFDQLFQSQYNKDKLNYFKLTENPHGIEHKSEIQAGKAIKIGGGSQLTIIAVGPQLKNAVIAQKELLDEHDISAEIIYIHTIKPFDHEVVIESINKTRHAIVIEELSAHDGVFNLVINAWASRDRANIKQLAIDGFVHEYGCYEDLCEVAGLTAKAIVLHAKNMYENA